MRRFSSQFIFGAATAAYQIEGSPLADGAGASIWHRFAHTPNRIARGETGDVACDHYRRYPEDLRILADLGIAHYRLSFSWSRLFPTGRGVINPKGFDFYDRLIDGLLAHGITPMVTLYHWDLPAALDDLGGWLNPEIEHWFAEYAAACFKHFDDRVPRWVTINEPWVIADGGYMHGVLAPGHRSAYEAALVAHHLLKSHARAVRTYRTMGRHQIGIALNLEPKVAASDSDQDQMACQLADAYMNRQYLDPVLKGCVPPELKRIFKEAWFERSLADQEQIAVPIDFMGLNYYTRAVTRDEPKNWPVPAATVVQEQSSYTETGWEIFPQALTELLLRLKTEYGNPPIYITENGAALADPPVTAQGRIEDQHRIDYLRQHLHAILDAIDQGANVQGYYVWSLLDNLEWALGFSKRFGIVRVDPIDQHRTIKESGYFYQRVIRERGLP
jgi:beta-glucosidase